MPLLIGVSVFCLAKQNSLVFTNLFGGSSGNEGLGFLSLCFDWQYIAAGGSPMWMPLRTLVNSCIGTLGCVVLLISLYSANIWRAQSFPFLSQLLFNGSSNSTNFVVYNQTLILNEKKEIDSVAVHRHGIPWITSSYVDVLIVYSVAFTATFVHMLLWKYDDIKTGWSFARPSAFKKILKRWQWMLHNSATSRAQKAADRVNPDYKLLLAYDQVPEWWWASLLVVSFAVGLVCICVLETGLPWWGFTVATMIAGVF